MFRNTSFEVSAWTSFFSVSTPAPRLPMTMPGRAVKMLIFTLLAARSTSTAATPAWFSFCLTNFLKRRSSCSHFEKSFSEYHLELQPRTTPRRKPTGCVFCPIFRSILFLASPSPASRERAGERASLKSLFRNVHDDRHVRRAGVDAVCAAHRTSHPALLHRTAVDEHLRHDQLVGVGLLVLRRVGDRRPEHLREHAGRLALLKPQDRHRVLDRTAADHVGHRAHLAG